MLLRSLGVAHRQGDPVLDQGADPADQTGAVGGHHHPDAYTGSLLEQCGDPVHQDATVKRLEGLDEALPPVEEHDEVRQPFVGVDRSSLLADVGEAALGERLLTSRKLLLQERDQAVHPVGLGPGDDSADVWQRHQWQQCVVAGIDAVEVHVLGRAQPRDPAGEHAQAVAAAGARLTRDHQVRPGDHVPGLHHLPLVAGEVGASEGDRRDVG